MPSSLKSDAARRNGALSNGPVTPEGKAVSSRNAFKHGLSAMKNLCVTPAQQAEFDQMHAIFLNHFLPADPFEALHVFQISALAYRLRLAESIQRSLLHLEIDLHAPHLAATIENVDHEALLALGYKNLSDHSASIANLDRHESRLFRSYLRLLAELRATQARRKNENRQNEPNKA